MSVHPIAEIVKFGGGSTQDHSSFFLLKRQDFAFFLGGFTIDCDA